LVAGAEEGLGDQLEDLVGAAAEDELLGPHAELRGEPLAQPEARAVGIAVHAAERGADRLDGLRRGAERVLVGGELDHALQAQLALDLLDRLAGPGGIERGDPGLHAVGEAHGAPSPGATARGNEPSTRCECACAAASASAARTGGSSRWPSRSRKNRYSKGLSGIGRDWIEVRFTPCAAKGASSRCSAPGSALRTVKTTEVRSAPLRATGVRPSTRKRVVLSRRSSIARAAGTSP